MQKNEAFKAMASVGSTQALMKVVRADVHQVWEDSDAGSGLESLASIARGLADALTTALDGMREQAEKEYESAEVSADA